MASYKELSVWQKSYQLTLDIYSATKKFPKEELFGLVSQMRRSAVSIPSNVAEGNGRFGRKDHLQFIRIAYGSGSELETQLLLSRDLKYVSEEEFKKLNILLDEVMRMLNKLASSLSKI
ncbi:MAG: four helix bundle protein [Candidatus Nomurabacteria bacterium]|nr:four helix bundle protein [Candidatus Nomurabacteria bacterium]